MQIKLNTKVMIAVSVREIVTHLAGETLVVADKTGESLILQGKATESKSVALSDSKSKKPKKTKKKELPLYERWGE